MPGVHRHEIELCAAGMRFRHYPLWLDAHRKQELSFVSHAHSDHIARHRQVIATKPTLELMAHRLGKLAEPLPATYRRPFDLGPLTLELFPAGHVLGSAQLRVTRGAKRVVYTGDLNRAGSLTAEPTQVAECETLVIESTFGHPRYHFPSRDNALGMVQAFVERCRAHTEVPVLLAYSLGKAQEAVSFLGHAGYALCAHSSIHAVCNIYRQNGVPLPTVRPFQGSVQEGEVLLFPPMGGRSALRHLGRYRTAMLTGWAIDGSSRRQADELIPLSDHADFPFLIEYALTTGARQIFTVHGFCKELAAELRTRGRDARPLEQHAQLELF